MNKLILGFILTVFFTALFNVRCTTPPDYSVIPHIEFQSLSKSVVQSGEFIVDSVYVTLTFTDGDGDIGSSINQNETNVFVTNNYIKQPVTDATSIPFVPIQGTKNGISGTLRLRLFNTCCNTLPPCDKLTTRLYDTLTYDISIQDRAGHKSNVVTTPPIFLKCQPK